MPGVWDVALVDRAIGRISQAARETGTGMARPTDERWLSPGFIDIQINGYAGFDVNAERLTVDGLDQMVRVLWSTGVGLLLPTVVTGSTERLERAMKTIAAMKTTCASGASVLGVHLEGPFISPEDGPRGAHPKEHVRPPDWDEFQRLQEAAEGSVRIVTLAPELPHAIRFIERAVDSGVVVALGHTAASTAEIDAAVLAGASLSTHLGNGAHAVIRRHPNYIWDQLAADMLYASVIPDGIHLPASVLKAIIRAKGVHRTVLVTDAVAVAGMQPGVYHVLGSDVELTAEGKIMLKGTDYLAGSALRLDDGVGNALRLAGVSLAEGLTMVTANPAALLGVEKRVGSIRTGMDATVTVLRQTGAGNIVVEETIVEGKTVYRAGGHDA